MAFVRRSENLLKALQGLKDNGLSTTFQRLFESPLKAFELSSKDLLKALNLRLVAF